MKIAVTSVLPAINACVAAKLRSSKYLLIVDLGTMKYEAMPNPLLAVRGPAAGKLFAQQLLEAGVSKILVNKCSFDIRKFLGQAGIQIIDGMSGSVGSALEQFRKICMAETMIMPVESIRK